MPAVRTDFTDRSDGDFAIDAEPTALARRRAAVCPHPWSWLRQVHGTEVMVVRSPGEHAGAEADASVTDVVGAALSIQTADCVPVLLWSGESVIGAAHAGWRGLYEGVVEATVSQMEHLGATGIRAEIGPCISPAAYEFGRADLTRLALRFGPDAVAATTDGAPALDLRAAVRSVLTVLGVQLIGDLDPPCTATDPAVLLVAGAPRPGPAGVGDLAGTMSDGGVVERLAGRLEALQARIAAVGRQDVRVVAVTKGHPPEVLAVVAAVGIGDVGESYAQELGPKAATLAATGLRCHFVGQLQTNKVRAVADVVDVYQSVDRPSLVAELARRAPGATVLVQVDLAGAAGRGGVPPSDAPRLVALATDAGLDVVGLMGVAPRPGPGVETARSAFEQLARLQRELGLRELSIGMSDDLDDALAAGSTMVRVGTVLFGPRSV